MRLLQRLNIDEAKAAPAAQYTARSRTALCPLVDRLQSSTAFLFLFLLDRYGNRGEHLGKRELFDCVYCNEGRDLF